MPRPILSDREILLLLDRCISAEQKCDAREAEALAAGKTSLASYVKRLRQQYSTMKENLLSQMTGEGTSTQDLHDQLQKITREFAAIDDTNPGVHHSKILPPGIPSQDN